MSVSPELKRQFDFYIKNQSELTKNHEGKILLIHGEKLVGVFDTKTEAFQHGKSLFAPGSFMIIKCTPDESEYTVNYRTVARFSRLATA